MVINDSPPEKSELNLPSPKSVSSAITSSRSSNQSRVRLDSLTVKLTVKHGNSGIVIFSFSSAIKFCENLFSHSFLLLYRQTSCKFYFCCGSAVVHVTALFPKPRCMIYRIPLN